MKKDSDFYNEQIEILPELYKELAWEDNETGLIWFPTTINDPIKGMIFANGPSAQQWAWAAVKSIPVSEEEKEKYPIPGKPGEFYSMRIAMDTIQHFPERNFLDALGYIGVIPE